MIIRHTDTLPVLINPPSDRTARNCVRFDLSPCLPILIVPLIRRVECFPVILTKRYVIHIYTRRVNPVFRSVWMFTIIISSTRTRLFWWFIVAPLQPEDGFVRNSRLCRRVIHLWPIYVSIMARVMDFDFIKKTYPDRLRADDILSDYIALFHVALLQKIVPRCASKGFSVSEWLTYDVIYWYVDHENNFL